MTRSVSTMVLVAVCSAAAAAQTGGSRRFLTLDDYFELKTVSSPTISPDGRQIIYTLQTIDKMNDRRQSALWIMNGDGSNNRPFGEGGNVAWSPGGDRVAYTAAGKPRGAQIFVRRLGDGHTAQITQVERPPSALEWSPDGTQIAFTMPVERPVPSPIELAKPEGARWVDEPRLIERLNYQTDRVGYTYNSFRHLFVVAADGGAVRQLTDGPYSHSEGVWTPDGAQLLFSALRAEDAERQWRESEIFAVHVRSGDIRQLTSRRGPDSNPVVSPDGTKIAYLGFDWTRDRGAAHKLYVMNADGSNPRLVSPAWDRIPTRLFWAKDGSAIYFMAESEGHENLYAVALQGAAAMQVQPVTRGAHMIDVTDLTDGGQAVGTLSSHHQPADIVTFNVSNPGTLRRLTNVNEALLARRTLGKVEEIWFDSIDGFRVQGWYTLPPDFTPARKYPLQLHIHGGPASMAGVGFDFAFQEMAANGYVVLMTNPRGSTGYGQKFAAAINNDYPGKDYDDLMKAVDVMLDKGFIDPQNLFITGCSAGGILTAWAVTKTTRFAAAAARCTIVDYVAQAGTGDADGHQQYNRFAKLPWEDPTEWINHSAVYRLGHVKTPTLVMNGLNDLRTPTSQSEMLYRGLKLLGVPTALVLFYNEWHGTASTPSNVLRTQLYLRYWFDKHKRRGT